MFGRFVTTGNHPINQPLARFGDIAMMPGELIFGQRQLRAKNRQWLTVREVGAKLLALCRSR
jgi:hypothetical protein